MKRASGPFYPLRCSIQRLPKFKLPSMHLFSLLTCRYKPGYRCRCPFLRGSLQTTRLHVSMLFSPFLPFALLATLPLSCPSQRYNDGLIIRPSNLQRRMACQRRRINRTSQTMRHSPRPHAKDPPRRTSRPQHTRTMLRRSDEVRSNFRHCL